MCKIEYEIPAGGNVTVKVVDIIGSPVRVVMNSHDNAGKYTVNLNEESLLPGKYYYKVYLKTVKKSPLNGKPANNESLLISSGQVKLL